MKKRVFEQGKLLNEIVAELDLPKSVEEKVRERYQSLGDWFNREESTLKDVDIYVQGSFGQGTTIKPLQKDAEYDLDMSCTLNFSNFKSTYTQKELMKMMKLELELYRQKVGIQQVVDEKRRCLRLNYKDDVSFHLDFVPSIPLENEKAIEYSSILTKSFKEDKEFVSDLTKLAVNIPDKEKENYNKISADWHISNQRGYLLWFQSKMASQGRTLVKSSIEPIPVYKEKSVLQRCIQLLKRHRDTLYADENLIDSKPISIIITTLATRSYNGEQTIEEAIINILQKMSNHINSTVPRIPNPVKPEEDFTDRWDDPKFKHLELKRHFYLWLGQAKNDFRQLVEGQKAKQLSEILQKGLSINLSEESLVKNFGFESSVIQRKEISEPITKPWRNK